MRNVTYNGPEDGDESITGCKVDGTLFKRGVKQEVSDELASKAENAKGEKFTVTGGPKPSTSKAD